MTADGSHSSGDFDTRPHTHTPSHTCEPVGLKQIWALFDDRRVKAKKTGDALSDNASGLYAVVNVCGAPFRLPQSRDPRVTDGGIGQTFAAQLSALWPGCFSRDDCVPVLNDDYSFDITTSNAPAPILSTFLFSRAAPILFGRLRWRGARH